MSNVVEKKMFTCTDPVTNMNKFWEYTLYDDDTFTARFGRVGDAGEVKGPWPAARLASKIKSKTRPGRKGGEYREVTIVGAAARAAPAQSSAEVAAAAREQLAKNNPTLVSLVDLLVAKNKHELHIASKGAMELNSVSGQIETAVGIVSKRDISEAREVLDRLALRVPTGDYNDAQFMNLLGDYLRRVPQNVGRRRGWHEYFLTPQTLPQQYTLLDQLEQSADLAEARAKAPTAATTKLSDTPNLFSAEIEICDDKKIQKWIEKQFLDTVNKIHETRDLRPVRVYSIVIPSMSKAFELDGAKVGNIRDLWHGTRVFNLLSILKGGLVIPRSTASNVTGRMFGDGLYFSDQSTKSLNYSYGYWDGGPRDAQCFMLMNKVAMGKEFIPTGYGVRTIPKGYDSCFAKAGHGGVRNNEMIVYRTSQANVKYLVEFDKRK